MELHGFLALLCGTMGTTYSISVLGDLGKSFPHQPFLRDSIAVGQWFLPYKYFFLVLV